MFSPSQRVRGTDFEYCTVATVQQTTSGCVEANELFKIRKYIMLQVEEEYFQPRYSRGLDWEEDGGRGEAEV